MRTLYLFILMMTGLVASLNGQHPQWVNYTHTKNTAQAVCLDSTLLWAGTSGGLVVTDITTTQQTFYDKSNSGLPGLLVTAVHRDAAGVLWFGDFEFGLTRFNGVNWQTWHMGNSPLPHNAISDIAHDHNNTLWVATQGGLASFNGTQWSVYTAYGSVQCVTVGPDSSIWFGAQTHGLIRFKNGIFDFFNTANTLIPSNYILDLVTESPNRLWIATTSGLVLREDTAFILFNTSNSGLPHNLVRCISVDPSGKKWIGTQGGGLALFNDTTWQVFNQSNSSMPCNYIFALANSTDGRGFIASCTQLGAFNGVHWTQYPTSNSGMPAGPVQAIGHSPGGMAWVGTTNGLVSFNGTMWNGVNTIPSSHINAIATDSAGRVWVGTGNGLAMYDAGVWTSYTSATSGLMTDVISSIAFGSGNRVYIGGYGGVSLYDGTTWSTWTPLNTPLPDPSVMSVAVDNSGAVWIGMETGGIARVVDTVWTLFPRPLFGTPGTEVRTLLPDQAGGLWVGSIGGLSHFNSNTWIIYTMSNSPLPSPVITAINRDSLHRIWVGTTAGLALRDTAGNWTLFHAYNSGIPSNAVGALSFDASGRLWVGTYFGGAGVYDAQQTTTPFVYTIQAFTTGLTTATATGEITHDGGTPVTTRGVVWDTIPNPTLAQNLGGLTTGSGTGTFTANLSGLQAGTLYYVRTFAMNSAGTSYGNTLSFNTQHIGITELSTFPTIRIFPNPCIHNLNLEAAKPMNALQWFDLSGRMVIQQRFHAATTVSLPTTGLRPGIYLIHIQFDDGEVLREKVTLGPR
jgi:ligand-binding sensor domain-containing protein